MTDQYLIEAGIDNYLLEDGLGSYVIDQRIEVKNDTVGLVETKNNTFIKNVGGNTVGISESHNEADGFVKNTTLSTLGITEVLNELRTEFDYLLEDGSGFGYLLEDSAGIYIQDYPLKVQNTTVGVTEASQKITGFLKNIASTVGLTDAQNKVTGFFKVVTSALVAIEGVVNSLLTEINVYALEVGDNYELEDGAGRYELDQLEILKNIAFTVGITEASQKLRGLIEQISQTVELNESSNRAMVMFRNVTTATVGLVEATNRLGVWIRNLSSTVGLTESNNPAQVMLRNIATATVGITEASNRLRGRIKNLTSTVGVTEVNNLVSGIVQQIASTIGITEVNNRVRSVFIDFDLMNMISVAGVSFANFIANVSQDNSDITVIDSYNIGDLNLSDTN